VTATAKTPRGQLIYESLKAQYVDPGRLLATLKSDRHSGYVRLTTDASDYFLLLNRGVVTSCIRHYDGQADIGASVLTQFTEDVNLGRGFIDVVKLDPEAASNVLGIQSPNQNPIVGRGSGVVLRVCLFFLPRDIRVRWSEEWGAEISQLDSRWSRARFACSLLCAMPLFARAVRSRSRKSG
jgi:hypothetical protein